LRGYTGFLAPTRCGYLWAGFWLTTLRIPHLPYTVTIFRCLDATMPVSDPRSWDSFGRSVWVAPPSRAAVHAALPCRLFLPRRRAHRTFLLRVLALRCRFVLVPCLYAFCVPLQPFVLPLSGYTFIFRYRILFGSASAVSFLSHNAAVWCIRAYASCCGSVGLYSPLPSFGVLLRFWVSPSRLARALRARVYAGFSRTGLQRSVPLYAYCAPFITAACRMPDSVGSVQHAFRPRRAAAQRRWHCWVHCYNDIGCRLATAVLT